MSNQHAELIPGAPRQHSPIVNSVPASQSAPVAIAPAAGDQSLDLINTVFDGRRDLLAERLTLALVDLGGLAYEMAIRNHFRLDILVQKAAELQAVDAELGQLDRLLSLGQAGAAGDCPNCGALFARGSAFCARCGFELVKASNAQSAPHVATADESLSTPGLIKEDHIENRHPPASLD